MKHQDIIKKMTLEEKAAFLSGANEWQSREIKRLQIPAIACSDGPHGIRRQAGEGDHLGLNASLPATCFPTAATVANSWDVKKKSEEAGKPDLNILFIYNMPFRALAKMTAGMVSMEMAEGMVTVVNGHFFKGMKMVIGGFFRNRKANKEYRKLLTKE